MYRQTFACAFVFLTAFSLLLVSCSLVVNKDGLVKFNDFNNCKVLEYNPLVNDYCPFENWCVSLMAHTFPKASG